MLSRHLAQPRTVHLVQVIHILKYLDQHNRNELYFDPAYHNLKDAALVQARMKSMKEMYPDAVEDLPPNSTLPRGNPAEVNFFVDSDHGM